MKALQRPNSEKAYTAECRPHICTKMTSVVEFQGVQSRKELGEAKPMIRHNLPPEWDRVNISNNFGRLRPWRVMCEIFGKTFFCNFKKDFSKVDWKTNEQITIFEIRCLIICTSEIANTLFPICYEMKNRPILDINLLFQNL